MIEKHNNQGSKEPEGNGDRIAGMEAENDRLSRLLQEEFSNNKLLKKDNMKIKVLNRQLLTVNQVLVEANRRERQKYDSLRREVTTVRMPETRLLCQLIDSFLGNQAQNESSSICTFLRELRSKALTTLQLEEANGQGTREREGPGEQAEQTKQTTRKGKMYREGAMNLAVNLKRDVDQLRLAKDLKGARKKQGSPEERGEDEDRKAWSFVEDHEKQESNFESKMQELDTSNILDA